MLRGLCIAPEAELKGERGLRFASEFVQRVTSGWLAKDRAGRRAGGRDILVRRLMQVGLRHHYPLVGEKARPSLLHAVTAIAERISKPSSPGEHPVIFAGEKEALNRAERVRARLLEGSLVGWLVDKSCGPTHIS